eukprot:356396-Chlamydomonas_euryale.AAC.4
MPGGDLMDVWGALQTLPSLLFPHPQDKFHLYFLFDLMPGGDLMDVLVAEAKVIKYPVEENPLRRGSLAPKMKMWQVHSRPVRMELMWAAWG